MELNIYHLYPEHLNLYGDLGNVNCLKRRCLERGIEVNVVNFTDDEKPDLNDGDIFFIGGGSDRAQQLVYKDFLQYKDVLKELIEEGRAVLAVCGGYQLLGTSFIDKQGNNIPGLSILDYESKYTGDKRIIGNIIIETTLNLEPNKLVGFENHGARTYSKYQPLGNVLVGRGNNDDDMKEGIVLILQALRNKYEDVESLEPLDDEIENKAYEKFIKLYGK